MNIIFKEVDINEIRDVINESDEGHYFLPHKEEPDFKASELFGYFIQTFGTVNLFSCLIDNNITGFVSILPSDEVGVMSIGPMFISPKYQGLGLGKLQVEKVMEWAKDKSLKKLYTKTWGQNLRSRHIFESLNFTLQEVVMDQRINGDSSVKYEYFIRYDE